MLRIISSLLGMIAGLALAVGVHRLTWQLRLRFQAATVVLGLIGATIFAWLMVQLFSPYFGIPRIYPALLLAFVLAVIVFLVFSQARRTPIPWWLATSAQFTNILFVLLLVLVSAILRDRLISLLYPRYGEFAFDLIYSFQTWLSGALILGLPLVEALRSYRTRG